MTERVLVTGMSGYIASHTAKRLLEKGYRVRGTVRNAAKGQAVARLICGAAGAEVNSIEIVEADLSSDTGWAEAVKDCDYIQHIASPLPISPPSDRESLVPEARAGAQRVLEHGFSAGAKRIVMTSSIAAMIGQKGRGKHFKFGENDWTDPDWKSQTAYPVSKTRAELSAWAYVEAQNIKDRLTVINPGMVFGPDPFRNGSASLTVIKALLTKEFPRSPRLAFPVIDVRDVAAIHVAAMTAPNAAGRRLIAGKETLWFKDMANILKAEYPQANLPKGELPNIMLRLIAVFDDRLKTLLADLGIFNEADSAYVSTITQVIPRPAKEAILATAKSMIESGRVDLG